MKQQILKVDKNGYFLEFNPHGKPQFTTDETKAHRFIPKEQPNENEHLNEVKDTLESFGYNATVQWLYVNVRSKSASVLQEEMIESLYKFFHHQLLSEHEERTLSEMLHYVDKNLKINQ